MDYSVNMKLRPEQYLADWPDFPYNNFIEWLDGVEQKWPNNQAILYRCGKQKDFDIWNYTKLAGETRRIARGLLAKGYKKGDHVALWLENRPEWMIIWLAAAISGLIIVPIDFTINEKECANILGFTQPKAFFCSAKKQDFVNRLKTENTFIDSYISLDEKSPLNYWNFGKDDEAQALPPSSSIAPNDPVSIIFTSGTTGVAKGVTLHHKGIIANVNAAVISLRAYPWDVFINVLPLHHTYPTTCSFFAPLSVGAGTIIVEKLVGKVVLDDIRDGKGTFLIAVPLLYDKVMAGVKANMSKLSPIAQIFIKVLRIKSLFFSKYGIPQVGKIVLKFVRKKMGLQTVRIMVAGGGPLNPNTADFFDSLGFCMVHGYGMSENSPLISVNTPWHKNNVSVGLAVKYTDVKIIDQDKDGVGEIAYKSPSLMLGYYENIEATKEVFDDDGYLKSGDLGYIDDKGYIFINGRKKNLIVSSGGKNIYPEEIEAHFDGSRVIGEILVTAKKDEGGGEEVYGLIYPNYETLAEDYPENKNDESFVFDLVKKEVEQVNRGLTGYKKISDFRLVKEEFEKNAQKKIKRFLYKDIV
jgi:long-chain acyl-CoA synthetase